MKQIRLLLALFTFGFLLFLTSCKKEKGDTLHLLYKTYENGKISECQYKGQLVYSAGLNWHDAGSKIYDQDGKEIAKCNYAWGQPSSMCGELKKCETIYRVKNNIWGQPAVDKYGLGK